MAVPVFAYSWPRPPAGQETRVTWSFADFDLTSQFSRQYSNYPDFEYTFNEFWRPTIRSAFEAWDKVTGIDFIEVSDSINSDIRLGEAYIDGSPSVGTSTLGIARTWFVGSTIDTSAIIFDFDARSSTDVLYWTALHEIGHAMGIDHSSSTSDIMNGFRNPRVTGLSKDDIAAAQSLYGPDPTTGPSVGIPQYVLNAARLYEAGLNRKFDAGGLNFWIDQIESGRSFDNLAAVFLDSAEFTSRYGDDDRMSSAQFCRQMYLNVLDREPDSAGLSFWINRMSAGSSRESVLAEFALSPENVSNTGYLSTLHQVTSGYWDL